MTHVALDIGGLVQCPRGGKDACFQGNISEDIQSMRPHGDPNGTCLANPVAGIKQSWDRGVCSQASFLPRGRWIRSGAQFARLFGALATTLAFARGPIRSDSGKYYAVLYSSPLPFLPYWPIMCKRIRCTLDKIVQASTSRAG